MTHDLGSQGLPGMRTVTWLQAALAHERGDRVDGKEEGMDAGRPQHQPGNTRALQSLESALSEGQG